MKYRVTLDGDERDIDVTIAPDGRIVVTGDDGKALDVDVARVPGGISLIAGGRVYDLAFGGLAFGGRADAMQIAAGPARASAQVVSERARARTKRSGGSSGGEKELRAPMPGRVVKVLVAAGAEIAAGAPCVVVEAMKMENELRSPVAGKVAAVHVVEGVSVEGQALLVTFE
jgi:biotin carboxyl carrier protein